MSKLEQDLARFTGSECYYRFTNTVMLSEGAAYLAKEAKALWLMDVIASYVARIPTQESFLVAVLHKNERSKRSWFSPSAM